MLSKPKNKMRMIAEKQKEIIFNTTCLYQLVGQVSKIENKEAIQMLPEISMFAMFHNDRDSINWHKETIGLYTKSISLGLSQKWTTKLGNTVLKYTKIRGNLQEFRTVFINSVDLMLNMINSKALSAIHVPKEHLAQSIVEDIFEKDCWEGETADQVKTIRKLHTELNFPKEWVLEFSKVLLKNLE